MSKADAVWRRIGDLFGADALTRKFGTVPPDTWVAAIERLTDFQLERGMRRLVYGGKAHVPTLPEFLRMCREIGGEEWQDADGSKVPPSHQIEHQPQPRWMREGNLHLLGYITRQAEKGVHYCCAETLSLERRLQLVGPSQETIELVQPLVDAKNAWAADMLEAEREGRLPKDNGKQWWEGAMRYAEERVAMLRTQIAA